MYCVYITTYLGNKLPPKYIGSSSVNKIENGYKGSVSSAEYKNIWLNEIRHNPHLFETEIVYRNDDRKKCLEKELELQIELNVVKSEKWINKSLAKSTGFFGMNVKGENNPMYGKSRKSEKHKGGENISRSLQEFFKTEKSNNHRSKSHERMKENNPSQNPEIMKKLKSSWKKNGRNVGSKNGMYGKASPMRGKKLYNNGVETKAFVENQQPDGWIRGRHNG